MILLARGLWLVASLTTRDPHAKENANLDAQRPLGSFSSLNLRIRRMGRREANARVPRTKNDEAARSAFLAAWQSV